jgi:glyoxylase-like metal-dependent hydrolase (beta-lactamase superfamily II)
MKFHHRALTMCRPFLAVAAALVLAAPAARAAAPMAGFQAPGFYRMKLGAFEVTALSDGTSQMPEKMLDAPQEQLHKGMDAGFLKSLETSDNAYLVNTGAKLILVDTGSGKLLAPTLGKLAGNLKAAGYAPEQVDEIYLTHMHPDHIGGLVADARPVFANAIVRASREEAGTWLSQQKMDAAPEDQKRRYRLAVGSLDPYAASGHFKPFDKGDELQPGIRAVEAPGHTPGHTVYLLESQGQKLALWGDLLVASALQFSNPSVASGFDSDGAAASATRMRFFAEAASQGYWVAAAHIAFPGIGHLRRRHTGGGYTFVPANNSPLP